MTLLTQRALRVFAVLEHYRAGSDDILDALLPFFEPLLAELSGKVLDPDGFATRVTDIYRWNFTRDIVEELIPRFKKRGWVTEIPAGTQDAAYRVSYSIPKPSNGEEPETAITLVLSEIGQEFRAFVADLSPLSVFQRSEEELSEILVEWLVSLDAYTEAVLREHVVQTTNTEGILGLNVELPDASRLTSEERYLCARFVKNLFKAKSPHIQSLCRIASVGLLTEVIQDFRKPITQVSKTTLFLYLDAPVALDLLGTSGVAAAQNIRPILAKLAEIGAEIRIFADSVHEVQRNLTALLRRSAGERTGVTADALRRGEVMEAYVREVAADPQPALTTHGVKIIERKLDLYPREHEYFTKDHRQLLFQRMAWHWEVKPRDHDATVITHIMRLRAGSRSRDLFQTKYLLVTRNGLLAQGARRFCVDQDLMPIASVGPAIHQRQRGGPENLDRRISGFSA